MLMHRDNFACYVKTGHDNVISQFSGHARSLYPLAHNQRYVHTASYMRAN